MADVAQFGVEVPPVEGVDAAVKQILKIGEAAEETERRVRAALAKTALTPEAQKALLPTLAKGIFQGFQDEMAKASRENDRFTQALRRGDAAALAQATAIRKAREEAAQASSVQRQLGNATQATGQMMMTQVKHLALLAAGYFTVHKAIQVFGDALSKAGAAQAGQTTLRLMVGDAQAAARALQQIGVVAGNVKIFDEDELTAVAVRLKAASVATQNLGTYLQGLSILAAKAGVGVDQMAQAWLQAMKGGVRASTVEGDTIMRQLGETTGRTMKEVRQGLRDGSIGARDFTSALIAAAQNTDALAERQGDYLTKLRMLGNAWDDVLKAFGTPIIDMLGPHLREWTKGMADGKSEAAAWGQAVADAIEKILGVASKLRDVWRESLVIHDKLFGGVSKELLDPATALPPGWKVLTPGVPGGPPKAGGADVGAGAAFGELDDTNQSLDDLSEKMRDLSRDFSGDYRVIIDYWEDYANAQQFSFTEQGRNFRTLEAVTKAIRGMSNPMEDVKRLMPGLSPDQQQLAGWMAWREAADRAIAMTELRMKAGMASMGESVRHGLAVMINGWGTLHEQVSRSVTDIGNAIAGGLSAGLAEMLNGTKSVKQGFKDMALSIIQDIERIILKMMVQLAIQQLLAAFGYGGGSAAGGWMTNLSQGIGRAGGGAIPGRGETDSVPAMLTPGEFVINKRSAQRIGYGRLMMLNRMAAGGEVRRGRRRYGDWADWEVPLPGGGWSEPPDLFDWGYPRPTTSWSWGGGDSPSTEAWGGSDNPIANRFMAGFAGFGTSPWQGASMFGPTMIPTLWTNYPGVGAVPMAVPPGGWTADPNTLNIATARHSIRPVPKAAGGLVESYPLMYASGGMAPMGRPFGGAGAFVQRNSNVNQISVVINNNGGRTTSRASGPGLNDREGREMARAMIAVAQSVVDKNRRVGGSTYIARSGRGG